MKYFYDTEFYEDGKQIHLISIGIVCEDGREMYAENHDFDWSIVPPDHWIQENVKPHLIGISASYTKEEIAKYVKEFICDKEIPYYTKNKLYGYYVAYDHVALAQLFGTMVNMPKGLPWFSYDLKVMMEEDYRIYDTASKVAHRGAEHNALTDARWNKDLYDYIRNTTIGVY